MFPHFPWCHNGWSSNVFIGGCQRSRYTLRLRYWMFIHYETVEDGKTRKSHLSFSFLVRIVLFVHFIERIYLSKILSKMHWTIFRFVSFLSFFLSFFFFFFFFFFVVKFHLSSKKWLLIYKYKKKNSKIPPKSEEIIIFCLAWMKWGWG